MAVSDEQLANNAREALNAIITGQVSAMSEGARSLTNLSVAELQQIIDHFEAKAARASRRVFQPITRVNL